ncbi:hypothetical protein ACIPSA_36035 [Streptomyces sp. NPDC086549]|uniref:hypothetical protein n=1 Tax=Streptomyces sp. NPDC086549 TaxID=3365752 RepID=UPI00382B60D7
MLQLCAPLLGRLGESPSPQREVLQTAFGQRGGTRPDGFFAGLAGLAVLGLRSLAAAKQPLMCLVDEHTESI